MEENNKTEENNSNSTNVVANVSDNDAKENKEVNTVTETKKSNKIIGFLEKVAGRPLKLVDKIVLGVLVVVFLFVFYVVLDANKFSAVAQVVGGEGRVGVNPTTEVLDFGDLSLGSSAVRRVKIENGTIMPMYIMVFKIGSISDLIDINKNNFKLEKNTEVKIDFTMYIPASAEVERKYSGRVYLFKIPTFWL